ncbi:excalibur calcium-binding domain-containing protein [Deinococcus sp. Marseille-Q6407]|uniref:excalibur calcium-binding domain-containing protein n=1 Tax=Deinococcus sp. Marseille-Q6407 TaxID=2969223 RepID=UPI0021BF966A|nr:excalibur calcium-binding domain-containing protein [Deinococcus sp. Marseille-Q6407]
MKKLILGLSVLTFLAANSAEAGRVHVDGYYRSDGTYVRPHYRNTGGGSPSYSSPSYSTPAYMPQYSPANSPRPAFSFSSCDEARNRGLSNMVIGTAAYDADLDQDKDGIACEAGESGSTSAPIVVPAGVNLTGIQFNPIQPNYQPKIMGGITYFSVVALRDAGASYALMGQDSYLINAKDKQLELSLSSKVAKINYKSYTLSALPFLLDEELFIPADVLSPMGCTIKTLRPLLEASCLNGMQLSTGRILPR